MAQGEVRRSVGWAKGACTALEDEKFFGGHSSVAVVSGSGRT